MATGQLGHAPWAAPLGRSPEGDGGGGGGITSIIGTAPIIANTVAGVTTISLGAIPAATLAATYAAGAAPADSTIATDVTRGPVVIGYANPGAVDQPALRIATTSPTQITKLFHVDAAIQGGVYLGNTGKVGFVSEIIANSQGTMEAWVANAAGDVLGGASGNAAGDQGFRTSRHNNGSGNTVFFSNDINYLLALQMVTGDWNARINGAVELVSGNSTNVSAANRGKLIYDSGSQSFQTSANGGAFASLPSFAGVAGGQTITGGTAAGDPLILRSTANATKGLVTILGGGDVAPALIQSAITTYTKGTLTLESTAALGHTTLLFLANAAQRGAIRADYLGDMHYTAGGATHFYSGADLGTEPFRINVSGALALLGLAGTTASGGNLDLQSTQHATKGLTRIGGSTGFIFDETNKRLGIGLTPGNAVDISASSPVVKVLGTNAFGSASLNLTASVGANFLIQAFGGSTSGSQFGQTVAARTVVQEQTRDLMIGTVAAKFLLFGTSDVERMRFSSAGIVSLGTAANPIATTANGSVVTTLGTVGPAGANTVVQEWLTVTLNGNVRYIPCW